MMAKERVVNLQLHITHQSLLPSREKFNDYTIPRFRKVIDAIGGPFELWEHRASERISADIRYTSSTFPTKLADAMKQMDPIGDIVDEALMKLWRIRS